VILFKVKPWARHLLSLFLLAFAFFYPSAHDTCGGAILTEGRNTEITAVFYVSDVCARDRMLRPHPAEHLSGKQCVMFLGNSGKAKEA